LPNFEIHTSSVPGTGKRPSAPRASPSRLAPRASRK
jgi:hypothetical protein